MVHLAPSEREIVNVLFEKPGSYTIEQRTPTKTYVLGNIEVRSEAVATSFAREFENLRQGSRDSVERELLLRYAGRRPDKILAIVGEMPGMRHHGEGHGVGIEWEDTMKMMNRKSTPKNMNWKLIDRDTGKMNQEIDWVFSKGDLVKVRIVNETESDHPMQHPIHFYGQRFLVLSRDGVENGNLVWKDSALLRTGETIDILLEATDPGSWMAHCHISEHIEGGMMLTFLVW